MKVKKGTLYVLTAVASVAIALAFFWVPSFFVDEFYDVTITYAEKSVTITPAPDELQKASISKWTDVSATFKNGSGGSCSVEVQAARLTKNFSLEKNAEYGVLLPKKETITITFCGEKQDIRIQ